MFGMHGFIKRKWNSQHVPPCHKGVYKRKQHLIFFYLCTWFSCIKKIGQSCVCWAVGPALQSNSSNYLVLIPHRQLGNFDFYEIRRSFAGSICQKLATTIEGLETPVDVKLKLIPIFQNMHHDVQTVTKVSDISYNESYTEVRSELLCWKTENKNNSLVHDSPTNLQDRTIFFIQLNNVYNDIYMRRSPPYVKFPATRWHNTGIPVPLFQFQQYCVAAFRLQLKNLPKSFTIITTMVH